MDDIEENGDAAQGGLTDELSRRLTVKDVVSRRSIDPQV
jgi:hypothetical protein